jgi:hypothetical protein
MPSASQIYIPHPRAPHLFFHVTALVLALLKAAQPLKHIVQGTSLDFGIDSHLALHFSAQNKNTELCLAHSAAPKQDFS